jgi:hypothetical protein
MFKKSLAAVGVAGLLVLGASSAAMADDNYTSDVQVTATDVTLTPGQGTVITATNVDGTTVFETSGAGVNANTLTSISFAAVAASDDAIKEAGDDRTAQATFTAPGPGEYTVLVTDADGDSESITLTVAAAGTGGTGGSGTGGSLPATGGDAVPAAAVWLGAGAVGLGGIAVTAAVARRRAAANR